MKMFGSGISYLTVDLIGIWKSSDEHDFAEKRDRYALGKQVILCFSRPLFYVFRLGLWLMFTLQHNCATIVS